ncbi:alpha/beta hydrolase family protein [Nocardioides mangrovi]|uniref:S9 family peptidase n=1 Tax=Nocardioides mangrovi TaxID=2874580 RepID=A0ABS7UBH6_9ACTN|nr:prolyl oligopeptidase family serine peptidase [Nocardioides mangrovi]MBZ5738348.1 S9 family peptidase [Nocardioides mangrovi]
MRRRTLLTLPAVLGLAAACSSEAHDSQEDPPMTDAARHVAYGDDPSQFGELSLPHGDPVGTAVVVHGGFWKPAYGIEYARPLVPSLVEAGWAVWAIEYRRGTGAADTLADVRAAIDARPDVDGPVVGIGHSAGGHLVTWAAGHGGLTQVISQAGVLDLRAAYDEGLGGGAVEMFLGHPPAEADADVDPIQQVPLDVPVWCVHATGDDTVPISQSRDYVAAATKAGADATLLEVDGDHFTVIDPDSDAWARTLEVLYQVES